MESETVSIVGQDVFDSVRARKIKKIFTRDDFDLAKIQRSKASKYKRNRLSNKTELFIGCETITEDALRLIPEIVLGHASTVKQFTFLDIYLHDFIHKFMAYTEQQDPEALRVRGESLEITIRSDSVIAVRSAIWFARLTRCNTISLAWCHSLEGVSSSGEYLPKTTAPDLRAFKSINLYQDPCDDALVEIAESCPNIRTISIIGPPFFRKGIEAIASLRGLENLTIIPDHESYDEWEAMIMTPLQKAKKLTSIAVASPKSPGPHAHELARKSRSLVKYVVEGGDASAIQGTIDSRRMDEDGMSTALIVLPIPLDMISAIAPYLRRG